MVKIHYELLFQGYLMLFKRIKAGENFHRLIQILSVFYLQLINK